MQDSKFTKEYISLCKNEKIQGLRPDIKCGDYCINTEAKHFFLNTEDYEPGRRDYRKNLVWLPLSGQLDDYIVGICKEKSYNYTFEWQIDRTNGDTYYAGINDGEYIYKYTRNFNPLIAKLLLLIKLLESK